MAAKKYHIVRALIRFTTALVFLFNSLIPSAGNVSALSENAITSGSVQAENKSLSIAKSVQPIPLKFTHPHPRFGSRDSTQPDAINIANSVRLQGAASTVIVAESTFDAGIEGWTVINDGSQPVHFPTGGVGNSGYIESTDSVGGQYWYWNAPAKFLGDVSSAYNGSLSFYLKQSSTTLQRNRDDIILTGAGITLVYNTSYNPKTTWTYYSVSLNEAAGWTNQATGLAATQENMLAVLGNLQTLRIRGEYRYGADIGGLDSVILATSQPVIQDISTIGGGNGDRCFAITYMSAQGFKAGPINTRTGGYDYTGVDLSVPTLAGELTFQREYTSLSIDFPSSLSQGWVHNHDIRLIFSTDPEGQPDRVLFKAHTANRYIFNVNSDGTFSAYPGLCATLEEIPGTPTTYVLKDGGQKTYTFETDGKLQTYSDEQGNAWNYTYNANNKLDRIDTDGGARYISLHYDPQGRIDLVSDQTGRSVSYNYDANGDLSSVVDVTQETWTYEYLNHLMTRVAAPGDVTVERNEYDSQGRAWRQYDGENNLVVELTFNADGTTTITDALGNTETHTYDERGTLVSDAKTYGGETQKEYDNNFRPRIITDGQGNTTNLTWSADGVNLTQIKDALLNQTNITYGAYNNPTSVVDPLNYETKYFYDDVNFPAQPTRVEYPLSYDGGLTYIGTDYEYYQPGNLEGQPAGKVKFVTDALGNQTYYTYISSGQTESVTVAYGTANALTTTYAYDDLGRLTDSTDGAGIVTHNEYDAAGRLKRTIRNYDPARVKNEADMYNIETQYFYDARGNQIAVVDTYDVITRTYFDLNNRPVTVVQNLYVNGIILDDINTPLASVPGYSTANPDRNIRTDTVYDEVGNVIASIDTEGIITRTYYDQANQPEYIFQNWAGVDLYDPVPPACTATAADQNICTRMYYDANDNLIATKDVDGIITRTYYDELNRPKAVVQNLVGQLITDPDPPLRGALDQNIRTDTIYDENGNVIATVDPAGVITRTYYDAMNRPITVVQHLAGQSLYDSTAPNRISGATDSNIRTDTFYDQAGNVIATQDALGAVTRTYYDAVNRPVTVVQNLVGQDIYVGTPPARGSGALPDQNVRSDTLYDQNGRREASIDPLGRETRYEYDQSGRLVKVTVNYVDGLPQNDQDKFNIVTEYTHNALGQQVTQTDTLGRVSWIDYDALGRSVRSTRNYLPGQPQNYQDPSGNWYNLVTSFSYDSQGNQIGVTDTTGVITRTYSDALNRPIAVVRNLVGQDIYSSTPPGRGDPPDPEQNLRTDTIYNSNGSADQVVDELGQATTFGYDGLGRQTRVTDALSNPTQYEYNSSGHLLKTIDANAVATKYEYDAVGRLSAVVENFQDGVAPNHEINVRTEYAYDANGNRLSILDGNGHATTFTHDAFGRLKSESDALGHTNAYGYDVMGNRVTLDDANGNTITYHYDELNRLELIDYPAPDADVTFDYDPLGRRTDMTDEIGFTTWQYNNLNLPTLITDPFGTEITYDYDALGNRTNLGYDTQALVYKYDALNRLYEVTGSGLPDKVEYGYDATGRVKTVTRPNGVDTAYTYYNNGWLQGITHSTDTTTLASFQYDYYGNGNRSQAIENIAWPSLPPTPTPTFTPTETATATVTPTSTDTLTPTPTPTFTLTETATPTGTATHTITPTATESLTPTATGTATETPIFTATPTATLANTVTSTFTPPNTATPAGQVLVLQPGASEGLDTYISSANKNSNYGTDTVMGIGENNSETSVTRSLIKFDLTQIPNDAIITSASLSLWISEDLSSNDRDFRVYRLKIPFDESEATWRNAAQGVGWQADGASGFDDRETVEIGSIQILADEAINTEKQIDLDPARIQELVNGSFANNGFILVADTEDNDLFNYYTSDTTVPSQRPRLVVEYIVLPTSTPAPTITPINTKPSPSPTIHVPPPPEQPEPLTNVTPIYTVPYGTETEDPFITITPSPTPTQAPTITGTATYTSTPTGIPSATTSPTSTFTVTPAGTPIPSGPITITYNYDPLNRLTEANYDSGDYYHYTYDAVGNREAQEKYIAGLLTNDSYLYDIANRLISVNGLAYDWDDNGNLLSDGGNTYTYNSANRLTTLTGPSDTIQYAYNGLGDRLQDTVGGQTTSFTMDLNTGLTQALSDGTNDYLYGIDRIAQINTSAEYFLGDALGSVRQITDATGAITYTRSYDPYGVVTQTSGASQTSFGYTNEYTDSYIKLIYLRSRWYDPASGRFPTRDSWQGNYNRPQSLNRWNYVHGDPINYTDPAGYSPDCVIKGTCGPDLTQWFMNEMDNHYNYGVEIKNKVRRMKALAVTITNVTPCTDIFTLLSLVAIEPPFNQIVREFNFPKTNVPIGITPLITPDLANKTIDVLGALEYALYGVSVYYGQLKYETPDKSCNTYGCDSVLKGKNAHPIITLCDQCRDATDLGNMMFGLGGAARGYSWNFTLGSAVLFNILDGDPSSILVDGAGALPGWVIGRGGLYKNRNTFCLVADVPIVGHDMPDLVKACRPCETAKTGDHTTPSSLISITNTSTIKDLETRLNRKIDEKFKWILEKLR